MSEPMTEERIAELREVAQSMGPPSTAFQAIHACLNEIESLLAVVERLRKRLRRCCCQQCSKCGGWSLGLAEGSENCSCVHDNETETERRNNE